MKTWRKFTRTVRAGLVSVTDSELATVNRAVARLELARNYRGVSINGASTKATRGYSALMAVFLAYTAAEKVALLHNQRGLKWKIEHGELARSLRGQIRSLFADAIEHNIAKRNMTDFDRFMNDSTDDVRIVATIIRHSFAHGSLTATGASALSLRSSQNVFALADLILKAADEHLDDWIISKLKPQ